MRPPPRFLERYGSLMLLIVAVGIVFLMTSWPAIDGPRRSPRRHQCLNNLKQVVYAIQNYTSVNHDQLPPAKSGPQELSWRVLSLPGLDASAMFRAYHRDQPWNDPANDEFAKTKLPVFLCPDNPSPRDAQGRYYSSYALLTGPGTAFDGPEPISLDEFSDGVTQTILLVEACGAKIVWNEPRDIDVSEYTPGVETLTKTQPTSTAWISSYHMGSGTVGFADGSVKWISQKIDPEILKALATPNGNDRLDPKSW